MDKMIYFKIAIIFFLLALLTTCRLEGDIEALRKKSVENTGPSIPEPGPSIPAPGAPVVIASDGLLTVMWAIVEEAEGYEVYVSTTQNPPASPQKTVSVTTTIVDKLINKTVYYVWVKAINETGYSDFSARASGIPWPASESPATPERPVIIAGVNQLTVTWEESGGAASYEVYINTSTTRPPAPEITTGKASAVINNLENGVVYYVWVRAANGAGKSGYSPIEAGTPRIPTVAPAAPATAPTVIAGSVQLAVSWQAVEGAAVYEVWAGTANDPNTATKRGGDVSGLSAVIAGLTYGTTYYVWVKAKNSIGTSGFSPVASGTPSVLATAPQAPSVPEVSIGNGHITVTWAAVQGAAAYEVWLGTENNSASALKHGADIIDSLSATIDGLNNGTTYYIWLKAKNSAGTSGFSPPASGRPIADAAVPSLTAGNARISAIWTATAGADQYEVFYGTGENPLQTPAQTINAPATSAVITGLVNGTSYNVWIRGKNPTGTGTMSSPANAKPIGDMEAVTVNTGDGRISLSWSAVAGADEYEVYYSTANTIPSNPAQTVSTTTATINGLVNGTTYYVWVKPHNANGMGGTSAAESGRPLGTPGAPAVSPGYNQLVVSWTAVPGADEYEVYYGTDTTPTTLATTTTGNTATITGLTNGTMYYVRLRAKNANGVSDYGPSVSHVPSIGPGLYRGDERIGGQNLSAALSYISANAVGGEDFYIVLGANELVSPANLNYSGKNVGITLTGSGGERTITLNANGSMFTVNNGITLTLDENITLRGLSTNNAPLITVNSGSTLIMNEGAKISGNTNNRIAGAGVGIYVAGTVIMNGGEISGNISNSNIIGIGICVQNGGTITMNGGTISGNSGNYGGEAIYVAGTITMNDGVISGNSAGILINGGTATMHGGVISGNSGAGVYSSGSSTFTMYGGVISGNSGAGFILGIGLKKLPSDGGQNSGIIYGSEETGVDAGGVPLKNTGGAVGSFYSPSQRRNTTAGQTDHIDSETGRGLSLSGDAPFGN